MGVVSAQWTRLRDDGVRLEDKPCRRDRKGVGYIDLRLCSVYTKQGPRVRVQASILVATVIINFHYFATCF